MLQNVIINVVDTNDLVLQSEYYATSYMGRASRLSICLTVCLSLPCLPTTQDGKSHRLNFNVVDVM